MVFIQQSDVRGRCEDRVITSAADVNFTLVTSPNPSSMTMTRNALSLDAAAAAESVWPPLFGSQPVPCPPSTSMTGTTSSTDSIQWNLPDGIMNPSAMHDLTSMPNTNANDDGSGGGEMSFPKAAFLSLHGLTASQSTSVVSSGMQSVSATPLMAAEASILQPVSVSSEPKNAADILSHHLVYGPKLSIEEYSPLRFSTVGPIFSSASPATCVVVTSANSQLIDPTLGIKVKLSEAPDHVTVQSSAPTVRILPGKATPTPSTTQLRLVSQLDTTPTAVQLLPDGPLIDPGSPAGGGPFGGGTTTQQVRLVPSTLKRKQPLPPAPVKKRRPLLPSETTSSTNSCSPSSEKRRNIEEVTCYKCKLCGYLGLTVKKVEEHMMHEHVDDFLQPEDWLGVAQRENIRLHCPMCENTFIAEGSRSFKVHLTDDHCVSEAEADRHYRECNKQRRDRAMVVLKREKEEERLKRTKGQQDILEAYVDEKTLELRVRTIKRDIVVDNLDISAKEYVDALECSKKQQVVKKEQDNNNVELCRRKTAKRQAIQQNVRGKKKKMGRPRGSRTVGITALKRVNSAIELSEQEMGAKCQVSGCGVRLRDVDKLVYHRRCHDNKGETFKCPECGVSKKFWRNAALHLWRDHKLDMELLTCDQCPGFRAFTRWRRDLHMAFHSEDRPHLCSLCGKGFKIERHMKEHVARHEGVNIGNKEEQQQQRLFECKVCARGFVEQRVLKQHVASVHAKLRPHLCNYCGYSASTKSTLKIHERKHTGEKPYACTHCDYRTSDHNTLRRHKSRHTGEHKYKCPYCQYSCIQASTYSQHLRNKHKEQASADGHLFQCPSCDYGSLNSHNLKVHQAIHSASNNAIIDGQMDNKMSRVIVIKPSEVQQFEAQQL